MARSPGPVMFSDLCPRPVTPTQLSEAIAPLAMAAGHGEARRRKLCPSLAVWAHSPSAVSRQNVPGACFQAEAAGAAG